MVVLAYAYTNLIYSVLMSTVKPNLPKNLHELLKLDEIKVYTFQHPDDGEYMNGIEDLLQIVVHFEAWGNKIVEPVNSTNDFAVFDKTVLSLAYHGVVGAKAISPKFIAIQNFGNMRTFTALLEETGRTVVAPIGRHGVPPEAKISRAGPQRDGHGEPDIVRHENQHEEVGQHELCDV
ncbi:hypothetical protein Fcan01_17267 [Folsomia candida]|uniref:Uncharacterized protein n=1 Tax=Folsomia candida TaxID=158441 RepID=A0A226DVY2_FOLCA|nr:hypothetical protein Fcan01_17267 [Folsomia candida]